MPAGSTVDVISPEYAEPCCAHCGEKRLCFNAQVVGEPKRPVITACKDCIEQRAGGSEQVFVKDTWRGLPDLWRRNRRPAQPTQFAKSRETP